MESSEDDLDNQAHGQCCATCPGDGVGVVHMNQGHKQLACLSISNDTLNRKFHRSDRTLCSM